MLGLGWSEIFVIAVVALIFVGPKDLPAMLRNIGQTVGAVRRMSNEFRRELNKIAAIDEVKEISRSITSPINQTRADLSREFNQIRDGKVEPTGKIKPKDGEDDVYGAIAEKAGVAPAAEAATAGKPATARARAARAKTEAQAAVAADTLATEPAKAAAPKRKAATGTKAKSTKAKASRPKATKPKANAEAAPSDESTPAAPKRVRKARTAAAQPPAEQPILETAESGDTQ